MLGFEPLRLAAPPPAAAHSSPKERSAMSQAVLQPTTLKSSVGAHSSVGAGGYIAELPPKDQASCMLQSKVLVTVQVK